MTDESGSANPRIDHVTADVPEGDEIELTITGEGFTEDVSVVLGGAVVEADLVSPHELHVVTSEDAIGDDGLINLALKGPGGDVPADEFRVFGLAHAEPAFDYPGPLSGDADEEFSASTGLAGDSDEDYGPAAGLAGNGDEEK